MEFDVWPASHDDAVDGGFGGEIDGLPQVHGAPSRKREVDLHDADQRVASPVTEGGEVDLGSKDVGGPTRFERSVRPTLTLVIGLTITGILILAAVSDFKEKKLSLREVYGLLGGAVIGMLGRDFVLPEAKKGKGKR